MKTDTSNSMDIIKKRFILILISFLLINAGELFAGPQFHIKGAIQVKSDSSITVNFFEILVDSTTKIVNSSDSALTLNDLNVGDYVIVDAVPQGFGKFVASEIQVNNIKMNYQFQGKVTVITSNSLTVGSNEIFVDSNTVIMTQFHAGLSFSDLTVGDFVIIKAVKQTDGTYLAVVIWDQTSYTHKEIEVEGNIESMTDSSISVKGTEFIVNSSTVILSRMTGLLKLSDLSVGQQVSVRGLMTNDSSYVALTINLSDEKFVKKDFVFEGPITEMDSSSLVVGKVKCYVDSATVIFADQGDMLNFSDLSLGDVVEVKATLQDDGTYKANRIKLENNKSKNTIEIGGVIDSVAADHLSIGGIKIFINSSSKIYSGFKQTVPFADLTGGTFVEINASLQDSVYYASQIRVMENKDFDVLITGAIDNIDGSNVTVGGVVFSTDDNTEILGTNRLPITIADLTVGQIVNVSAVAQTDGKYYAEKIRAVYFWRSFVIVEGPIDSLSENSITVLNKTFLVDSTTYVFGNWHEPLSFSSLSVGLKAEVKGTVDSNGTFKAQLIKIHPANEFRLYAKIDSLISPQILLAGFSINTDSSTVFYDEFNRVTAFDSLSAGQFVEIQYTKTNSDEYVATRVEIEMRPGFIVCHGILTMKNLTFFELSGSSFGFNNRTVMINSGYKSINSASINIGQQVTILAIPDKYGNLKVEQIQLNSDAITGVEKDKSEDLPTSFKLFQNYPNPFNPETKISFSLPYTQNVTLKIYNIIGQEVATLVNGSMNAGLHVVDFNGTNFASGIYFYSLRAGDFVAVKKMILLK